MSTSTIAEREAALVASGWQIRKPVGNGQFWAAKSLGSGPNVTQSAESLAKLLETCESWDADQARLKPEYRLGGGA